MSRPTRITRTGRLLAKYARLLANALRLRYYRRALDEIDLLHPDLPAIVRRIRHLEAERDALHS